MGESRGLLREPSRWSALSLPTMSIGQEVSVTALQMVAAFGAVANGGTLMQPRLVRSIFEADGREVRRFEPVAVRQVISKETAQTLTRILTRVVTDGTGHNAAIAGYDVAGKTGTAQKLDPATRRYSRAPGVLSFVGFAPVDAPRFVDPIKHRLHASFDIHAPIRHRPGQIDASANDDLRSSDPDLSCPSGPRTAREDEDYEG